MNITRLAASWCSLVVFGLAILSTRALASDSLPEWARGQGESLEIRLTGEVVGANDQVAPDFTVTCQLNAAVVKYSLPARIDGRHFEIWVPAKNINWNWMWIRVASRDEKFVAYQKLAAYELRHAAINGLQFELTTQPTRTVAVRVEYQDQPAPNAWVNAELGYDINLRTQANEDGIATFHLLPEQQLARFTAWTDDFKMGGFSFNSKPTEDSAANELTVELNQCQDRLLRVVDEEGTPVPDLAFVPQIATIPDYDFVGINENSHLKTNSAGEVTYRWFPNWKERKCYIAIDSKHWIAEGGCEELDEAIVFKVKKSKIAQRKRVVGKITGTPSTLAGFHVTLYTFQGERENLSSELYAFSDATGSFAMDVLPDATYCAFVLDSDFVSPTIDLIPYDSSLDKITAPELSVSKGEEVEVTVTSGPDKKPYPDLTIRFRREHEFSWREDGRSRNATGGPAWQATTNDQGIAVTNSLPGKLQVHVYTPLWSTEEEVDVSLGTAIHVSLHRSFEEKQKVIGQLVLGEGVDADLSNAQVRIGSVDGNYDDQQSLATDAKGAFYFETVSTELGVFARTQDGRAAGSVVVRDLSEPIMLELRSTMSYTGQLLNSEGQPSVGQQVEALVCVEGTENGQGLFLKHFDAERITAKTDSDGKYVLPDIPTEMNVILLARNQQDSSESDYLDVVYLEAHEDRPLAIHRIGTIKPSADKDSLAERIEKTLRDCRLAGFRMMVITSRADAPSKAFIDRYFKDYQENREVSSYMQIVLTDADVLPTSRGADFAKQRGWKIPDPGKVLAYAIDDRGNELGTIEVKLEEQESADLATAFVHQHMPVAVDAEQKWDQAFAEARQSDKQVWARICQRYCGPCFLLARWMDDHRELLAKDFVLLKIDDVRDENGFEVANRLTRGKQHGVPFHAIYDSNESMLIDSAGKFGNIGNPSGYEGKKHLRKMLEAGCKRLTAAEIDLLVDSVED